MGQSGLGICRAARGVEGGDHLLDLCIPFSVLVGCVVRVFLLLFVEVREQRGHALALAHNQLTGGLEVGQARTIRIGSVEGGELVWGEQGTTSRGRTASNTAKASMNQPATMDDDD